MGEVKTFAAAAALFLAACSQAPQQPTTQPDRPIDAVRVALPSPGPLPSPRARDAKAVWSGGATAAAFGYPGEEPLVTLECRAGQVVVTRHALAEDRAQALFALIGNGTILRLPVDAVRLPGSAWPVWQGVLAADDPRSAVFLGGAVEATLPGAGTIMLAGGGAMQEVAQGCGAGAAGAAARIPEPGPAGPEVGEEP